MYVRISDASDDVDKTANQEEDLRALAERQGWTVAKVYRDDDISAHGGKHDRPQFRALLAATLASEHDLILATENQRLTRGSATELEALTTACLRSGTRLHLLRGGEQSLDSATARATLAILDIIGGLEVEVGKERQAARYASETSKGLPLWGPRPYGFQSAREWDLVDDEADLIRVAYRDVLDDGTTLYAVAKKWNEAGHRTTQAGKARYLRGRAKERNPDDRVLSDGLWTPASVKKLLLRPRNAGLLAARGAVLEPKVKPDNTIVTRADWERMTRHLKPKKKNSVSVGENRTTQLLTGIMRCPCGKALRASTSASKVKGKVYSYEVYDCAHRGHQGAGKAHASIGRDKADAVVRAAVISAHLFGHFQDPEADDLRVIEQRLGEIEKSREGIRALMRSGALTSEEASADLLATAAEADDLRAKEQGLRAARAASRILVGLPAARKGRLSIAETAERSERIGTEFDALPIERRRELVRYLVDVELQPKGSTGERVKVRHRIVDSLNEEDPAPPK